MPKNSSLRTGPGAAIKSLFPGDRTRGRCYQIGRSARTAKRSLVSSKRWSPQDSLEDIISSALVAQDKELARILQEIGKLSEALKSAAPQAQTLTHALQRALMSTVKQSHLDRELRSLALKDDLTRLYNRRAFLALAGQQLKVAHRKGQGVLLFFADLDNLKKINDTYGHREGDLALVRTARSLERTFRDSDVVARLAGDEFAVLALEAACENRKVILRRLDENLSASSSGESRYKLSLSIGVARFDPDRPAPLAKLVSMADDAMYEQKRYRLKLKAS